MTMTSDQRKRLLRGCQDDPCCLVNREKGIVTIIHDGVRMAFQYDPKHDCGSGEIVSIKIAHNDRTQPLHDSLSRVVDQVLLRYADEVVTSGIDELEQLLDVIEEIKNGNTESVK